MTCRSSSTSEHTGRPCAYLKLRLALFPPAHDNPPPADTRFRQITAFPRWRQKRSMPTSSSSIVRSISPGVSIIGMKSALALLVVILHLHKLYHPPCIFCKCLSVVIKVQLFSVMHLFIPLDGM